MMIAGKQGQKVLCPPSVLALDIGVESRKKKKKRKLIIVIIIMKNFHRRSSHGHRGSKRRELAQHAHSRGSHAFTHTLYINTVTTTTWCEAAAELLQNL